jgi:hypothetical protein
MKTGKRLPFFMARASITHVAVKCGLLSVLFLTTAETHGITQPPDSPLPDAATVMKNVVARERELSRAGRLNFTYEKHSILHAWNKAGKDLLNKDETYQMIPIRGRQYGRLIKVGNRDLTKEESSQQHKKEAEFRKALADNGPQARSKKRTRLSDEDLIKYFSIQVQGRDNIEGRQMLILSFRPNGERHENKGLVDKALLTLTGTAWVDESDWQITAVKARSTEKVSIGWFGIVGSIKSCELEFKRTRLEDGIWMPDKMTIEALGRKGFESVRVNGTEESRDFKKL